MLSHPLSVITATGGSVLSIAHSSASNSARSFDCASGRVMAKEISGVQTSIRRSLVRETVGISFSSQEGAPPHFQGDLKNKVDFAHHRQLLLASTLTLETWQLEF